jgi:predicted HicB family RNase H-like nuclease
MLFARQAAILTCTQNFLPYNLNMGKKRGRPPKPPEERGEERIELRLTTAAKAEWLKAAERAGIPLSAWIRERLDRAAKRENGR